MATKTQLLRKVFVGTDGTEKRSAFNGWSVLRFDLLSPTKDADGKGVVIDTFSINRSDVPTDMIECAAGHGLSQKLGDDLAGIAKKAEADNVSEDPTRGFVDYAKSRLTEAFENIKGGVWVEEGEGGAGASVTILLMAVQAAFVDAGSELTDEQIATVREKLKDETYRKAAASRPDVDLHVKRIRAERAAEAAKAARAKAKEAAKEGAADMSALLG